MLSIGMHWALLQSAAWVGMLVTYSRDASIAEAVAKTFDGKHPCRLCKLVEKGQGTHPGDSKKAPQASAKVVKIDMEATPVPRFTPPPADREAIVWISVTRERQPAAPPVPPPRFA